MQWITCLEGGPQRVNHAAVSIGNKIYSFGGYSSDEAFDNGQKIDIHVFDTDLLKWRPVHYTNVNAAPRKCYGHTVIAHGHKIYQWGGRNNLSASNTLYCFNTKSQEWSIMPTKGSVPSKVDGHTACIIGDFMYIFGGFEEQTETFSNSVHRLHLESLEWEKVYTRGEPPSSRDFHTASVTGDKMYVFGGRYMERETETYYNEIVFLDTKSMKWEKPLCGGKPPCGRRSHTAVVYHNEIYIIGGFDGLTKYHLNDIYKFNTEKKVWYKMHPNGEPPCPRRRHCSCIVGDHMFLFGGSSPLNEEEYARQYSTDGDTESGNHLALQDHSDLYILDFFPTLQRLCQLQIIKYNLRTDLLPWSLVKEINILATNSKILKSFYTRHPRNDYPRIANSA